MEKTLKIESLGPETQKPISDESWKSTLEYVEALLALESRHQLLDLCAGNGQFAIPLSKKCRKVCAVDISQDLLDEIIELQGENSNISTHVSDIRSMPLDLSVFDRVLWYAGIQYLDLQEVAEFFLKHLTKLPPDSVLFIGDIPDQEKIWEYFKSWEQKKAYFESLKRGQSRVGTWFSSKWLEELSRVAGFHEVLILKQPKNQIYSDFRYDLLARK